MVKHIILWTLKDQYSGAQMDEIKAGVKAGLEGLAGKIPGLLDVKVNIDGLPSSNVDMMLDSTFTDFDALKAYGTNPDHVAVADEKIRPFLSDRKCMDFEV